MAGLQELVEKVLEISRSPRYGRLRREPPRVPVYGTNFLDSFWSRILGFDLVEYFTDPERHLEVELRKRIYCSREIPDDTVISSTIGFHFGTVWIPSLFGLKPIFRRDTNPWPQRRPAIGSEDDLDEMQYPDFYESGLMPLAHRFFEAFDRLVGDRMEVAFPGWSLGPWGLAVALRGLNNILRDLYRSPDFVRRLLAFVTDARIRWERERASFLGVGIGPSALNEDWVDCNIISPRIYREFIYPYHRKLAEFYGAIKYFHSCGNLDPILGDIAGLPGMEMIHVSPWTSLKVASSALRDVTLEVRVHVTRFIISPRSEREMEDVLRSYLEEGRGARLVLMTSAIGAGSPEKVKLWVRVAKRVVRDLFGEGGEMPEETLADLASERLRIV